MNLVYADIIKVFTDNGQRMGKVNINGVLKVVPLLLLPDADIGDKILLCDGVPISKMINHKKGGDHVPGNTGESA